MTAQIDRSRRTLFDTIDALRAELADATDPAERHTLDQALRIALGRLDRLNAEHP